MPTGISSGFVYVTLPYLLTHLGFSVAMAAGIVAVGASASLWRFVWGPITDLTLSLKKWFWIALLTCTTMLMLLSVTPFTLKGAAFLTIIVFISQLAGNFLLVPIGGIMANRIEESRKGTAGGWYQAGNLGGMGLGGGVGLWLASHYTITIAGITLVAISLLCGLVVLRIQDVKKENHSGLRKEFAKMGKEILAMIKIPIVLFIICMLIMPIGTGAASNLWSAIAGDWKTDADTVALVTGILSGLVSSLGCVVGGYIADRFGTWIAYLGAGLVCAAVTLIMALMPLEPYVYVGGVLAYAFGLGLINAAFTYVILYAVGKRNAATKYSLLSSLGNIPVIYMTAFEGGAHDQFNSHYMLLAETGIGVLFVVICVFILNRMKAKKLLLARID